MTITISCSKHNEVRLQEVLRFVTSANQLRRNRWRVGRYLGDVVCDNIHHPVYAGDEVIINNVSLTLAYADDSYFDHELKINILHL